MTLSSTDMDSNVSGTWNVRAMPSLRALLRRERVTSRPSKCTVPEVGIRSPVRQLKNVDLPAPLGPIRPSTSPCVDGDGGVVDGLEGAERLGDVARVKQHGWPRSGLRLRRLGLRLAP